MSKDFSKLWELRRLVQEFEKLDENLIDLLRQMDFDKIKDGWNKIIELKEHIQQIIAIDLKEGLDPSFSTKLVKIRDNYGYNIDKLFPDEIWRGFQKEKAREKVWEQYLEREEDVDYFYLQRKNEIGTIICSTMLSENIERNLKNIKECYAKGMYDAAIVYCRALIEYATFKLRKRKRRIPQNASDFSSYKLTPALKDIEGLINPKILNHIKDVNDLAGKILHSKDANISYKLTPFEAIRWTFVFVEEVHNVK